MDKSNKTNGSSCWWECGVNTLIHWWWEWKLVRSLWKPVWLLLPTSLLGRYPRTLHPPAETLAHPCSLLLYTQPEIGNNLAVHQQKKGSGDVLRAHNRILLRCYKKQQQKKSWNFQVNGWSQKKITLTKVIQTQKTNILCIFLYVILAFKPSIHTLTFIQTQRLGVE